MPDKIDSYTHLHLHSSFGSIQDAVGKPAAYCNRAQVISPFIKPARQPTLKSYMEMNSTLQQTERCVALQMKRKMD